MIRSRALAGLVFGALFVALPLFAAPFAYITNEGDNNVSVIDTTTNAVVATVAVGMGPYGVAVNPAGTRVYVTDVITGHGNVAVIDTSTNSVIAAIPAAPNWGGSVGIALNSTGTRIYISNLYTNNLQVVDAATNATLTTISLAAAPFGIGPYGVVVSPDGASVYVASQSANVVSTIDANSNSLIGTIGVGVNPMGIAVNPSGTRLYVANSGTDNVSVIDTTAKIVLASVGVGHEPAGIAIDPSGSRVYVANFGSNTVSVIDTSTNSVVATVTLGNLPFGPLGVAVGPTGAHVYAVNQYTNSVNIIDTATNSVVGNIPVGNGASAFGQFIGPAPGRLSVNSIVNFGYQEARTVSANHAIPVTNVGRLTVSISGVSLSDVTNFGYSTSGCSTVPVGSSCTINIAFTPQSTGTFNATIAITSDGAGSPQHISLTGVGLGSGGPGNTIALVEYHHMAWDHYFVTGIPDEIAKLDAGVFVGWARTGQRFSAFTLGSPRTSPTCRFFSTSFAPRSSHFYTPFATECALVKTSPDWQFEAEVFGVLLPDLSGNCQAGTTQLYRLYNNGQGGAPNHRYTTDPATVQMMRAAGWVSEGNGPNVVFACVPA